MATLHQNSSEILREEILADARRQSDEIIRRAKEEAAAILAKAAADAGKVREERLGFARMDASRRKELILATVPLEAGRVWSARVEALLESIREEVRRRLTTRAGFDYRDTLLALATEAVHQMHGNVFVVKLSAADRSAFGDDLAREIPQRSGRSPLSVTVSNDATLADGGAIIEDVDGRQVWDNRLPARLERLWPELRRQIAIQTSLVVESKPAGGVA